MGLRNRFAGLGAVRTITEFSQLSRYKIYRRLQIVMLIHNLLVFKDQIHKWKKNHELETG